MVLYVKTFSILNEVRSTCVNLNACKIWVLSGSAAFRFPCDGNQVRIEARQASSCEDEHIQYLVCKLKICFYVILLILSIIKLPLMRYSKCVPVNITFKENMLWKLGRWLSGSGYEHTLHF